MNFRAKAGSAKPKKQSKHTKSKHNRPSRLNNTNFALITQDVMIKELQYKGYALSCSDSPTGKNEPYRVHAGEVLTYKDYGKMVPLITRMNITYKTQP